MKNVIFTITANDYFSQSLTLMQSIYKNSFLDNTELMIFIADRKSPLIDYNSYPFQVLFIDEIFSDKKIVEECRFKYNVLEYNVMLKPLIALFLCDKFDEIIYFDSDIFVYSSLLPIVEKLKSSDMVLTPHYNSVSCERIVSTEIGCVRCGFFNLGFFAVKNSKAAKKILSVWSKRLLDYCFVDRFSLYVDQKWMDSIFCHFYSNIFVLDDDCFNVAPWNFFERNVIKKGGAYFVSNRSDPKRIKKLVFFHFSGINLYCTGEKDILDMRKQEKTTCQYVNNDIVELVTEYLNELKENKFYEFNLIPYAFDFFDNGIKISSFNRAIFNTLLIENSKIVSSNPFSSNSSFYLLLKKKHLLNKRKNNTEIQANQLKNEKGKAKVINSMFQLVKKVIGINNFLLFNKYLAHICKEDNMDYLMNWRKK